MNFKFNLTTEQLGIKNHFIMGRGDFFVRAKAGSSKTFTSILGLNAANASQTAYLVFGKLNQLEAVPKITNDKVTVVTFHSIGFSFVRKNWRGVCANGYTEFGRIEKLFPDAPRRIIFLAAKLVSFLKNTSIVPTQKQAMDAILARDFETGAQATSEGWGNEKLVQMALESIKLSLEYPADKKISFEDMLWLPVAKNWIEKQFNLIVVDECQDCNEIQLEMIRRLRMEKGRICMIGDENQAIYNFRGATSNVIEKFKTEFSAKGFDLSISWRCPKKIIEMAKQLVPDIQASPTAIDGEVLQITNDGFLNTVKVGDVCLSRTNAPLMKNCLALIRKNVRAYVEGRDVGKGLINLIESFQPKEMADFYDKLDKWLTVRQQNNSAQAVANSNDQAQTLRVLAENCLNVEEIKNKINLLFQDAADVKTPSVVLMTVHKSKGKEWDNVFMLMETFARNGKRVLTPEEITEERNIKYVAITRAKKKLIQVA